MTKDDKTMFGLAMVFLGTIIGLVISTHFTHKQVACLFQDFSRPESDYCSGKMLQRGSKVRLKVSHPVYRSCEMTYLAGQATSDSNEVWVLLENCENESFMKVTTDIFKLEDLERVP